MEVFSLPYIKDSVMSEEGCVISRCRKALEMDFETFFPQLFLLEPEQKQLLAFCVLFVKVATENSVLT